MVKNKSIKIADFIKNIKAIRAEIIESKSVIESTLFSSRTEFIQNLFNSIVKKKDTKVF
jgi:hypothetical protein